MNTTDKNTFNTSNLNNQNNIKNISLLIRILFNISACDSIVSPDESNALNKIFDELNISQEEITATIPMLQKESSNWYNYKLNIDTIHSYNLSKDTLLNFYKYMEIIATVDKLTPIKNEILNYAYNTWGLCYYTKNNSTTFCYSTIFKSDSVEKIFFTTSRLILFTLLINTLILLLIFSSVLQLHYIIMLLNLMLFVLSYRIPYRLRKLFP